MATIARLVALPILAAAAFAAAAYASLYFAGYLFPRVVPRPYTEMVSAALVGAIAAALVSAVPLAKLFGRRAWLAALAVAAPWVALRISDLMHYARKNEPRIVVMSWVELLLYPVVLVGAAWFAASRYAKPRHSVT